MIRTTIFILFLFFGLSACIEVENPSNIPEITYQRHTADYCIDQLGNQNKCISLFFKLKDGDGNIGIRNSDTLPPFTGIYKHNFYFDVFIPTENGNQPWDELSINYFNIPYMEPEGQNKTLIADVQIDISFPINSLPYDTILISFYIFDRALNQSNTEMTDFIIFGSENQK
jgi:hypothetical protein